MAYEGLSKITARVPEDLWLRARTRALEDGIQFQQLLEEALKLRLKQRRPQELMAPEDLPEICWPPEDEGEGSFEVRDAILKLPEKQRLAVLSVYLEGRTYDEAAQHTAIPLGSLKRYLRAGLATLHTQLSEYHDSA